MEQELLRLDIVTRRITSEFYIKNIDLTIYKGEVLALAGKNAAGKSTLSGVINGYLPADSGRIYFEGKETAIPDTETAVKLGIITLPQNNPGFPNLTVADNILFGNDSLQKGFGMGPRRMEKLCAEAFEKLGASLDPRMQFGALTPAQRQVASIVRAYLFNAKLIIMDEPSSRLPQKECELLYRTVRALKGMGVSILYITHRLDEITALADRVAFVERGQIKKLRETAGLTELDLVEEIEGFRVNDIYSKQAVELGGELLSMRDVSAGGAGGITFTLHEGEIVAFLGNAGCCAQGIYRLLCGVQPYTGTVAVRGEERRIDNPLVSNALRIVPAIDAQTEQMMESYDSKGGTSTGLFARLTSAARDAGRGMGQALGGLVLFQRKEYMTGGFEQKELTQRALARDGDIYVLVDPTNGIDLQTRMQIYRDIGDLARRGRGTLVFTNDPAEAAGLADRIFVLDSNTIVFDTYARKTDAQALAKLLKE